MKCPHCAEEILAEAKICKHCGRKVRSGGAGRALLIVFGGAGALLLILLVVGATTTPAPPKEQSFEDIQAACQRDMPYDVQGCTMHIVLKRAEDVRQQGLSAAERDAKP